MSVTGWLFGAGVEVSRESAEDVAREVFGRPLVGRPGAEEQAYLEARDEGGRLGPIGRALVCLAFLRRRPGARARRLWIAAGVGGVAAVASTLAALLL